MKNADPSSLTESGYNDIIEIKITLYIHFQRLETYK